MKVRGISVRSDTSRCWPQQRTFAGVRRARRPVQGWLVFAGVRRATDGDALQQQLVGARGQAGREAPGSITPVLLDVTCPESISKAATQVRACLAALGDQPAGQPGPPLPAQLSALVNNAGKVTLAPLEFMPAEVFTDQLAVNLVGPMRVTQAFLPLLRPHAPPAQGQTSARIINISSQAGTVALPLFGGYCASKFGLEALSDCLRYELHGQGIDVVCIKPGAVKSDIWSRAHLASDKVLDGLPPAVHQLYGRVIEQIDVASRQAEAKGDSCEEVAQLIYKAATDAKPRARYFLGQAATVQMVARRLLPDWLWDRLLLDGLAKRQLEGAMPKGGA
ncbi:hypothetical protein QJQ45_025984 [Haematococcus lacustris]|nr:hypothetical protein QJQ45_025984 [Haematococcus lacustris]